MKTFRELREQVLQIKVDFDQDMDNELEDDLRYEYGIYVDDLRRGVLTVTGEKKDLMKWLMDKGDLGYGYDKRTADSIVRKGKKTRL